MSSQEKHQLPLAGPPPVMPSRRSRLPIVVLFSILAVLAYQLDIFSPSSIVESISHRHHGHQHHHKGRPKPARCPVQPPALNVGTDWNPLTDEIFAELAARRLSSAVQYATESYDDMIGLPFDNPKFDKQYAFADWLYHEYSKVFDNKTLKHEIVETHGQLLTWEGSNPDLQPILLMAHMDTVPVLPATLDLWTYPPFEGTITKDASPSTPGTWVWGRGSSDCKNSLLGIYAAIERLVSEGFQPERTILISNGFDEEIGGESAMAISKVMQERYGPDSVAFVVDEGFTGISFEYGSTVATFGMAEKGSVNVNIKVETLGGHSSVPPAHTGIGIMSLVLAELEANPFPPSLTPEAPFLKYLTCLSDNAPEFPKGLRKRVQDPKAWPKLAEELASKERVFNSFLATTQAIDLIDGGVKVNALPEVVKATVNHRIAFTSSINETLEYVSDRLVPLAKKLNFTISPFTADAPKSPSHITLEVSRNVGLEPAPITPDDAKAFELMAGTAKHVFGKDTIVAPSGMFANTDTRSMWNLTTNIFRFTPAVVSQNLNQHTVDERIALDGHLNTTRFFYKLLRNSEGWQAE
ncbi:hypothetical protein EHS25_003246 [Saitozyma podzolica]|uniref:Peptidase M20 dimerisation domain-containing protein n=1 Tax=Saitozyma podzolica TaxID=1890683 RepID=A0A427Y8H6_9TREE|nr:hypothetical protein EHS25_003246 [Saitozyma podzolica]